MAWTFVAAGTVATGASPAPAMPAGLAAGDLLLIVATDNVSAYAATQAGYQTLFNQTAAAPFLTIYWKVAVAGEGAPTLANSSDTTGKAVAFAYRSAQRRVDALGTLVTATGTTVATAATLTNGSGELVLSVYGSGVTATSTMTWTAPSGGTLATRVNSGASTTLSAILVCDEVGGLSPTTARTASMSRSVTAGAITIGFRNADWRGAEVVGSIGPRYTQLLNAYERAAYILQSRGQPTFPAASASALVDFSGSTAQGQAAQILPADASATVDFSGSSAEGASVQGAQTAPGDASSLVDFSGSTAQGQQKPASTDASAAVDFSGSVAAGTQAPTATSAQALIDFSGSQAAGAGVQTIAADASALVDFSGSTVEGAGGLFIPATSGMDASSFYRATFVALMRAKWIASYQQPVLPNAAYALVDFSASVAGGAALVAADAAAVIDFSQSTAGSPPPPPVGMDVRSALRLPATPAYQALLMAQMRESWIIGQLPAGAPAAYATITFTGLAGGAQKASAADAAAAITFTGAASGVQAATAVDAAATITFTGAAEGFGVQPPTAADATATILFSGSLAGQAGGGAGVVVSADAAARIDVGGTMAGRSIAPQIVLTGGRVQRQAARRWRQEEQDMADMRAMLPFVHRLHLEQGGRHATRQ